MNAQQPIFVALDLEATAPGAEAGEVIEVGIVRFSLDNDMCDVYSTLVRPEGIIPERIHRLTGIQAEDLRNAPRFSEIQSTITTMLQASTIVGHSIAFDRKRLEHHGIITPGPWIDTLELATLLLPELSSHSLTTVAQALGIPAAIHHRALEDAKVTATVFRALFARLEHLPPPTLLGLAGIIQANEWPLRHVFNLAVERSNATQRIPVLRPSNTHSDIGRELPRLSPNDIQPLQPARRRTPLTPEDLSQVWSPQGRLAQTFPGYEERDYQRTLSERIAEAFNKNEWLIAEAGTGTGKTLAYLVPAALWALQNGERVVISTNTVNLQDQILSKDIPDLERALDSHLTVQVLKGRQNYLCLLRWMEFRSRRALGLPPTVSEARALSKILMWLLHTETGDVADVALNGEEMGIWSQIMATQETCINDACVFKHRGQCFLFNARRKAEAAYLIIVNHALLLADLISNSRVIPEFHHVVVDEAHQLEQQATSSLSTTLSRRDLTLLLNEITPPESERPHQQPLLFQLHRFISNTASHPRLLQDFEAAEKVAQEVRIASDYLFNALENLLFPNSPGPSEEILRITQQMRASEQWQAVLLAGERWNDLASHLHEHIDSIEDKLGKLPETVREGIEAHRALLTSLAQRWREVRAQLSSLVDDVSDDHKVYWLSGSQSQPLTVHSAPLDVRSVLREQLYEPCATVILTSATLSTDHSFTYITDRLGMSQHTATVSIPSPFNYHEQVLLLDLEDLLEPQAPQYATQLHRALIEFARGSEGRGLALFTANATLRAAQRAIAPELARDGITVLAQGIDGSRQHLISTLRHQQRVFLLGSASFWEGIDVPGEALSALAIVRLPFTVPTDPVFAARSEQYTRPFDDYAVPQAIVRFRQGFGRLIRRTTDRGVLLILDSRIRTKYYGMRFLQSLPQCTRRTTTIRHIRTETADWLYRH